MLVVSGPFTSQNSGSFSGGPMKKFIWFILLVLLLATMSDHPRLKPYKQQLFDAFEESTHNAGQAQGDQVLRTIARRFGDISGELGQKQQQELQRISSSKTELLAFYHTYCKDGQFNPLFFGPTQKQICKIISEYERGL